MAWQRQRRGRRRKPRSRLSHFPRWKSALTTLLADPIFLRSLHQLLPFYIFGFMLQSPTVKAHTILAPGEYAER